VSALPLPKGFDVRQDGPEVVLAISPSIAFRFYPNDAEALARALRRAADEARDVRRPPNLDTPAI
jgi:hypothetical protein